MSDSATELEKVKQDVRSLLISAPNGMKFFYQYNSLVCFTSRSVMVCIWPGSLQISLKLLVMFLFNGN